MNGVPDHSCCEHRKTISCALGTARALTKPLELAMLVVHLLRGNAALHIRLRRASARSSHKLGMPVGKVSPYPRTEYEWINTS